MVCSDSRNWRRVMYDAVANDEEEDDDGDTSISVLLFSLSLCWPSNTWCRQLASFLAQWIKRSLINRFCCFCCRCRCCCCCCCSCFLCLILWWWLEVLGFVVAQAKIYIADYYYYYHDDDGDSNVYCLKWLPYFDIYSIDKPPGRETKFLYHHLRYGSMKAVRKKSKQ